MASSNVKPDVQLFLSRGYTGGTPKSYQTFSTVSLVVVIPWCCHVIFIALSIPITLLPLFPDHSLRSCSNTSIRIMFVVISLTPGFRVKTAIKNATLTVHLCRLSRSFISYRVPSTLVLYSSTLGTIDF